MAEKDSKLADGPVLVATLTALLEMGIKNPINALVIGEVATTLGKALHILVETHGPEIGAREHDAAGKAAQLILAAIAERCPSLQVSVPGAGFRAPGGEA